MRSRYRAQDGDDHDQYRVLAMADFGRIEFVRGGRAANMLNSAHHRRGADLRRPTPA
jgi:hypothetical protein